MYIKIGCIQLFPGYGLEQQVTMIHCFGTKVCQYKMSCRTTFYIPSLSLLLILFSYNIARD